MADTKIATSLKEKLQCLPDLSSGQPCIYKAPDHLLKVNEECYRPYVISIGPLYHGILGGPSLEAMQNYKLSCLKLFLEHPINSYNLEDYLGRVREWEGKVRDYYAESICLDSEQFNEMVLVDAVFIICLFTKYLPGEASSIDLSHMHKRNLLKWEYKLTRDLFLEENQIPFFVLEGLFKKAFGATFPTTSFLDLACDFIRDGKIPVVYKRAINADSYSVIRRNSEIGVVRNKVIDVDYEATIERIKKSTGKMEIVHLVDLLRKFCFPPALQEQAEKSTNNVLNPVQNIPPALQEQEERVTNEVSNPVQNIPPALPEHADQSTNEVSNTVHTIPPALQEQAEQLTNEVSNPVQNAPPTLQEQAEQPTNKVSNPVQAEVKFPSSISYLKAAEVKFCPSESTNLLDVTFSDGVLYIPRFEVWDVSESYFRSIILFEQSHLPIVENSFLHHYIVLLENLIRTPEDVDILVQSGIISNWVGSREKVARLFNGGITTHIPLPVNFCYAPLCKELNAYTDVKWNQHWASLRRYHSSHPWAAVSVTYALALLILSLAQTIGTYIK